MVGLHVGSLRCHLLVSTRGVAVSLRLEVVVVSMATAVPEPIAFAAKLVPEPSFKQLATSAVFCRLLASVTAARCHSYNVAIRA